MKVICAVGKIECDCRINFSSLQYEGRLKNVSADQDSIMECDKIWVNKWLILIDQLGGKKETMYLD